MEDNSRRTTPRNMLWNSCVPPKVCFFAWEAWWGRVLTTMHLKKRGFQMASRCPLCGRANEELNHLLIHCPSVWRLWEGLISIRGFSWACPYSKQNLFLGWFVFPIRERAKKLWRAAPLCLNWAIWKERNYIVFDNMHFSFTRLKSYFVSMVTS